jgi:hypothetical protein
MKLIKHIILHWRNLIHTKTLQSSQDTQPNCAWCNSMRHITCWCLMGEHMCTHLCEYVMMSGRPLGNTVTQRPYPSSHCRVRLTQAQSESCSHSFLGGEHELQKRGNEERLLSTEEGFYVLILVLDQEALKHTNVVHYQHRSVATTVHMASSCYHLPINHSWHQLDS